MKYKSGLALVACLPHSTSERDHIHSTPYAHTKTMSGKNKKLNYSGLTTKTLGS